MENGNCDVTREDDRKLFIGGLSWDTSDSDIKEYFGTFGEVENVNLKKDPYTQKSRGFAFVLFKNVQPVDKVLEAGEHVIKGKKVDPNRAKSRPAKIFVGGLNTEMSDDDIKDHFSQFGKIVEVEMPFDKQKNQRKGFCFITFEHEDILKEVLKEQKQTICGKKVDVKKATPRPEGGMMGPFGMMGGRGGPMRGFGRGRGRGRGRGFQGGWDQYGGYAPYGSYDYGYGESDGQTADTGAYYSGYDNYGYGGYGAGDYYGGGGYGGYGSNYGESYGGRHFQRGRGNIRQQPY